MTRRHQTLVSSFRVEREIFVIRGLRLTLSPPVPRTSPLSSSVFHTACALSAPTGHLPLEGKAAIREYHHLHLSTKIGHETKKIRHKN